MKILINDFDFERENYYQIFQRFGYETNEFIFRNCFEDSQNFILQHLLKDKDHIDLIITNDSGDIFKSSALVYFKNNLNDSFSNSNFRISSIPTILYSNNETKTENLFGFDAVIKKNTAGHHDYFIRKCESVIKNWRNDLIEDLGVLGLHKDNLKNFILSRLFKTYNFNCGRKSEYFFIQKTKIVSHEFIKCPSFLNYDWLNLSYSDIEKPILIFGKVFRHHKKYNRKNDERKVLHQPLMENSRLLTRDVYTDFAHEVNLYEGKTNFSQECDFILKNPGYQNTTFFEVKREDKKYYVNKKRKRPRQSIYFTDSLNQLWDYKRYAANPDYFNERTLKIGYETNNFSFELLVGREEEKEEMQELFDIDLKDHYPGVSVYSFEGFEKKYYKYVEKFSRLKI